MTIFTNGSSPITQVRPGVQIVTVPPQVLAAQPQASNVVALVGTATWGPVNQAIQIANPTQYNEVFGPVIDRKHDMGTALLAAYLQGASAFVCVRVDDTVYADVGTVTTPATADNASLDITVGADTHPAATITALYPGENGSTIYAQFLSGSRAGTIKATITLPGVGTEVYNNLPTDATFWPKLVAQVNLGQGANRPSQLVTLSQAGTPGTTAPTPNAATKYTLTGGTSATGSYDTAYTAAKVIGNVFKGTGLYALGKANVNYVVPVDVDTYGDWGTVDGWAQQNGVYAIVAGPAGELINNAIANKQVDSPWTSVVFGDWPTIFDATNQKYRQVSPAAFKAGVLAANSPNNSALNKPLHGIYATQRSGNFVNSTTSYSDLEVGNLLNAGIDIISSPSPGGQYFSFQGGRNASSNAAEDGDNYPQMTSVIGRTIASSAGHFVGRVMTPRLFIDVGVTIENGLANLVGQGLLNPNSFTVVCDSSNNPFSQTSIGILTVNVSVTYQSVVRFFNVMLEGGQTVQQVKVATA